MVNHRIAPLFVSVENLTDFGQAQPHNLAGLNEEQSTEMFLAVVAVSRSGPVRDDDMLVFPVAQHVRRYTELGCSLSDPHDSIIPS